MKSVLISIRPQWVEKIVSGKKTIEVRKTAPKEVPFKAYVYETKESKMRYLNDRFNSFFKNKSHYTDMGKVIGEFICDKITRYNCDKDFDEYFIAGYIGAYMPLKEMCLTNKDLIEYGKGRPLYGWHISDLKIYDKPKELSMFISPSKAKECVDYCINGICSNLGYEELCGAIRRCEYKKLTRPPQSYMFVEEINK